VMATRSGDVDPGLVLWLEQHESVTADELAQTLEHRSGLLGLAGTADMRELLTRTDAGARLALDVYVHRLRGGVARMAAALNGLDALVFTGGVGENATAIRAAVCKDASWLGLQLDDAANRGGGPQISEWLGALDIRVIPTDEELTIARHTKHHLQGRLPG